MRILLTLDYELFLGKETGSVEKCLINPMNKLLGEVSSTGAKFTLFVDAAYLYMLNKLKDKHQTLKKDYVSICKHLNYLQAEGHDIQLHIHPQWYFSKYDGVAWVLDEVHYKLCDVSESQIIKLFVESKKLLDEIVGKKTIAFRAGGFSAQPTELLGKLFRQSGIIIDSSVCSGNSYNSDSQKYDYTDAPTKSLYRFSEDICKEMPQGEFLELPISMIKVSPVFHWKLALTKMSVKFGRGERYKRMGDGQSVKTTGSSIFARLTRTVKTMATIDEFKASLLKKAYKESRDKGDECFCVLGHPKLATPYSFKKVGEFCKYVQKNGGEFVTISNLL